MDQACTDPRQIRSRERILAAAVELLREGGSSALTVEAVGARCGVAKTTIYRQFTDRDEIHLDAVKSISSPPLIVDKGDVVADVEQWLQWFAAALRDSDFAAMIPGCIEVSETSDRMRTLITELAVQRRAPIVDRLRTALDRGELAGSADADLLATLLVAPLFEHRYISHRETTMRFVSDVVTTILTPLLVRGHTSQRA